MSAADVHGPQQAPQAAHLTSPARLQHEQEKAHADAMDSAVQLTDPATSTAAPAAAAAASGASEGALCQL